MTDTITKFVADLKKQELLLPAWYEEGKIIMLDQTKLPQEVYLELATPEDVAKAIKDMVIRGSGAIALAGTYGVLLATLNSKGDPDEVKKAGELLRSTRPTAVNMHKTVEKLCTGIRELQGENLIAEMEKRVISVLNNQLEVEKKIGESGSQLLKDGDTILTVCNAGAVAGFGYGGRTLSVFRKAVEEGKKIKIIAAETRPYFQGARITAWELKKFNIPVTLITDNMVGALMQKGYIDKVITGSDRIAANGDTANKIGTYLIALACKDNGVPFYISTSRYNVDLKTSSGNEIKIEMRDGSEVLNINGKRIGPEGVNAYYPGFDVTPNNYISGIITEGGVLTKPFEEKLKQIVNSKEE